MLCGSLILSDACFQHRVSDSLSPSPSRPFFFSLPSSFSFRGSRRIPSKNKRVSPTWFLQSRKKEPSSPPPPPPPSARRRRRRHAFNAACILRIHRLHDASDIRNCVAKERRIPTREKSHV